MFWALAFHFVCLLVFFSSAQICKNVIMADLATRIRDYLLSQCDSVSSFDQEGKIFFDSFCVCWYFLACPDL